ncbi:MAG: hypothetical protein WAW90_01250 [Minisyncoccia bacterium]
MTNQSAIERVVMRRVRRMRILALIISTVTFAALTLVSALWGIGREVWVAHIFQNAPTDLMSMPSFWLAAFIHTHIIVQALTLLTLVSLAFLAREIVRAILQRVSTLSV